MMVIEEKAPLVDLEVGHGSGVDDMMVMEEKAPLVDLEVVHGSGVFNATHHQGLKSLEKLFRVSSERDDLFTLLIENHSRISDLHTSILPPLTTMTYDPLQMWTLLSLVDMALLTRPEDASRASLASHLQKWVQRDGETCVPLRSVFIRPNTGVEVTYDMVPFTAVEGGHILASLPSHATPDFRVTTTTCFDNVYPESSQVRQAALHAWDTGGDGLLQARVCSRALQIIALQLRLFQRGFQDRQTVRDLLLAQGRPETEAAAADEEMLKKTVNVVTTFAGYPGPLPAEGSAGAAVYSVEVMPWLQQVRRALDQALRAEEGDRQRVLTHKHLAKGRILWRQLLVRGGVTFQKS